MFRPSSFVAGAAILLSMTAQVSAQFFSPLVDFETAPINSAELSQEMFRTPEVAPTTSQFIVANPPGLFTSNAAFRSDQFPITDFASLRVYFSWVNPADTDAWLRLQTFNADVLPNPSVHLDGKIRFKLVNVGDFFDGEFGICLGIRETGANVPQLEDGGSVGDIEWVGVTGTAGTAPDLRPIPAVNVPVSANYILIEFDLATGHTWVGTAPTYTLVDQGGGIAAFTGNGVLDGVRGTLEHIAIVNNPSDPLVPMAFYIDDLQTEAPVPDPVFPPTVSSPIIQGDVTVSVIDLLSTADQVTLFRDAVFVETKPVVDPNVPLDFTIAPAAVAGECFTATQRESVSGDTSVPSNPVCTLPAPAVYTFNVCLDENGSNCSLDWEMVPAASRGTAPNGEIAPHGQVIFPNNAVWQTIDIPLDVSSLVTNWLGGDGVIAPGGTGLFSFDSIWFTSLGGPDALGSQEVFIDAVEALDAGGALLAPIYSFEDGTNYMANTRGQSNSTATSSVLSSLASFDGESSHRIQWSYSSSTVDDTLALYNGLGFACGTAPTFPDTTKTVRVRLLARTAYTGAAPQPEIVSPIVGTQTSVRVLNDPSAVAVQLYINGIAEGGPVLPAGTETDFAGLTLNPGDSVSATQVVAGETSDFAYPVAVAAQPFPPTTVGPIFPLSTEVTVTGLATSPFATASLVEVFVNNVSAGTAVPAGDTVVVTVPALNSSDVVEARQTVNGGVSAFSNQVIVSFPAPTIYYVPVDGESIVTVTGIEPTATQVTVTVNGTPFSTPYDPMIEPFEVTVAPALTAGQVVVAKYSAGAIESGDSISETVSSNATTEIFCDDFESYVDQAGFDAVWTPVLTQMIFSTDRNATLGGSKSAHAPDRNFRSSAGILTGVAGTDLEPAIFSINILDPSGGTGINQYADLDNLTTDFFLAEIGISNLAGAQTHYQARLLSNGGIGWFNLDQFDGPERTAGWHNFTMVFKGPPEGETVGHEVDIYVDGLLAGKNIPLTEDTVLREPRIGAGLSASGAPEGYFDDYCFYTGPLAIPTLPPVPPSVGSPLEAGDTTVTVNNIEPSATLVTVYANAVAIGSIDPAGAATIAVPVTSLVQYDTITATQFTTSESVQSSGLEVGNGNGDIFLSIGIRETGDAGPLGSPGSGIGSIEWIGTTTTASGAPNGILVSPQAAWQTIVFDPAQAVGFTGDGVVDGTRGVLEHLAVAVDSNALNRSTGAYQVFIDNVINVGAGAGSSDFVITDFEGLPLGDEALFQEPGNSGSTSANAQFPPDFSETVGIGNPGQSQSLGWFWIDTQAQRWQRISTGAVASVPSPIIDLTRPIQLDVLLLPPCSLKGDVNSDGVVNLLDVDAYVLALIDPAGFAAQHPFGCIENADVNNSGAADGEDSQPFVQLLLTP